VSGCLEKEAQISGIMQK